MPNAKVNDLENKINGATNLIHINQQNIDKQNLDQKIEDGDKKSRRCGLVTKTVPNTEIEEVNNKIPHLSGLVKLTNYDTKIFLIEGKYFTSSDYNKLQATYLMQR